MSEPVTGRGAAIYQAMTGVTAPGNHHDTPTGTAAESVKAGHEPDWFDARGIIMVPVLVVIVTTLAYFMVTGVFRWIQPGKPIVDEAVMSKAAMDAHNQPFNERVERISSTADHAEFHQPRLEYVRTVDDQRVGEAKPDAINLRSFQPAATNNTYEITPQDLYPELFVDPKTGKKLLWDAEWISKEKNIARIPVNDAIKLLAGKLPAKKDGVAPSGTVGKANFANGGQALAVPKPAAAPAKEGH